MSPKAYDPKYQTSDNSMEEYLMNFPKGIYLHLKSDLRNIKTLQITHYTHAQKKIGNGNL